MTKALTKKQTSDTEDNPEQPSSGIFVNYRQCDARGVRCSHAMFIGALHHQLAQHFGEEKVFIDRLTRAGSEYPSELKKKLKACDVLLVLIHTEWINDIRDRLGKGKDWVHYEIATVFGRGEAAVVIPVLLEDAELPRVSDLPEDHDLPEVAQLLVKIRADVQKLVLRQVFRLRSESLPSDITRLVSELETHVRPSWPVPKVEADKRIKQTSTSVSAALGWALGAFILTLFLGFVSTSEAPEQIFAVSGFSLVLMAAPLLVMGIIASSRQSIYKLERELFAEPSGRYLLFALILALGTIMVMLVMWGQPTPDLAGQVRSIVLVLIFVAALFGVGVAAVREDRTDRKWPPQVSTRPGPLRRTVARLHERLTSLWRPPLSRLQRDQAWNVFGQLTEVAETMKHDLARSRRDWLLADHPRTALGYSAWVAGTVGLAVGTLLALIVQGDAGLRTALLPVLCALAAGALSLGTMELGFRSQRKHRCWLITDLTADLDKQLRPHMPPRRTPADPDANSTSRS